MLGSGMVLQVIWIILMIVAVLLYMFSGELVWNAAYLILTSFVLVLLYFFPEGFIHVAECSVEERALVAAISLYMMFCLFLDHMCMQLKRLQNDIPSEIVLWFLALVSISPGISYAFYMVTGNNILMTMIVCIVILSVFLRQHIASFVTTMKQWKTSKHLTEYKIAGISFKILPVIVLLNITIVCCFIMASRSSFLLYALFFMYSELCFFVYRICCLPEMKGRVLYEMLLWILTLFVFGVIITCNLHSEMHGILLRTASLAFCIAIPGLFLVFSMKKIYKF